MATIYQTGSIDLFKPEVWTARLESNLQKKGVYADLANKDYEGEISGYGDTVHVPNIGRITLADYAVNGEIPELERLTDELTTLTITQAKSFNFGVDDIDKAQSKPAVMEEAMKEAAYSVSDAIDQYLASFYTAATNGPDLATALTTNKALVYDTFVDIRTKFRETDVPIDDLSAVIPPWLEAVVLKDDRFIHATAAGDNVLKNGEIGRLAGVRLVVSNNVPITATTDFHVLTFAGKKGLSYAGQVAKTEAYRPEKMFTAAVKGLHVFGANMMNPEYVQDSVFGKA